MRLNVRWLTRFGKSTNASGSPQLLANYYKISVDKSGNTPITKATRTALNYGEQVLSFWTHLNNGNQIPAAKLKEKTEAILALVKKEVPDVEKVLFIVYQGNDSLGSSDQLPPTQVFASRQLTPILRGQNIVASEAIPAGQVGLVFFAQKGTRGHGGFYEEGVQVIVIRKGSTPAATIEAKIKEIIQKNNQAVR